MSRLRKTELAKVGFGLIVAMIVTALGCAILALPGEESGLAGAVMLNLDQAGAKNPVTAVLLNFRGYDTLLEIAVLLLAVLGARALAVDESADDSEHFRSSINPVLIGFIRVIAPVMIIVAGYLLWVGGHAPGGAFQAGAVLASLGVLLVLADINWTQHLSDYSERILLTISLVVFLSVGLATMFNARNFLEFSPSTAKWCILLIEAVATVSIAVILLALFCCGKISNARKYHETTRGRVE